MGEVEKWGFLEIEALVLYLKTRWISCVEDSSCQLIPIPASEMSIPFYLSDEPLTGTKVNLNTDPNSVRFSRL